MGYPHHSCVLTVGPLTYLFVHRDSELATCITEGSEPDHMPSPESTTWSRMTTGSGSADLPAATDPFTPWRTTIAEAGPWTEIDMDGLPPRIRNPNGDPN